MRERSIAFSAKVHIQNAQAKGIQHKSMVKPALRQRPVPLGQLIKLLVHSKRYFWDMYVMNTGNKGNFTLERITTCPTWALSKIEAVPNQGISITYISYPGVANQ